MADAAASLRMTAAEYLAWEREQPDKHEFHLGEVFLMAGGSPRHNCLAAACAAELRTALSGTDCGVLSSDQRVSASRAERYVYPDVVVVCGPFEAEEGTADVLANPRLIVEVLSRSTERHDRGEKWEAYQRLPSLNDYVLASQHHARVEHYQRSDDGAWRYRMLDERDALVLDGGARVSVAAVFRGAFDYPADVDEG